MKVRKNKKLAGKGPTDKSQKLFWPGCKWLIISPHPDDEVFGCAGTMARAKALGCEVYVMMLSVGDLKFYEKKGMITAKERLKEVKEVARLLRWDDYDVVYTDNELHMRLDSLPRRELISKIEHQSKVALDKIRPDVLAIPAPSYNQDHVAVFEAAFTAARIHAGGLKASPEVVLVYESPTLYWNPGHQKFHPNVYVDIADYMSVKKRSIAAYLTQCRDPKDPCSVENVMDLAKLRGREVGREACEAYSAFRYVV